MQTQLVRATRRVALSLRGSLRSRSRCSNFARARHGRFYRHGKA